MQKQPQEFFRKKGVLLKLFVNFAGQYLRWCVCFLIRLWAFMPATLLKKLQHRCFIIKIAKFLKASILTILSMNGCQWNKLLPRDA